jgi:adenosylmethionine-8-amino-7-oxononanoate aminotransferase
VPETQLLTPTIRQKFLHAGLLIRPLGQTIYLLPPYSTTPAELADAYIKIRDILITV